MCYDSMWRDSFESPWCIGMRQPSFVSCMKLPWEPLFTLCISWTFRFEPEAMELRTMFDGGFFVEFRRSSYRPGRTKLFG